MESVQTNIWQMKILVNSFVYNQIKMIQKNVPFAKLDQNYNKIPVFVNLIVSLLKKDPIAYVILVNQDFIWLKVIYASLINLIVLNMKIPKKMKHMLTVNNVMMQHIWQILINKNSVFLKFNIAKNKIIMNAKNVLMNMLSMIIKEDVVLENSFLIVLNKLVILVPNVNPVMFLKMMSVKLSVIMMKTKKLVNVKMTNISNSLFFAYQLNQ